MRQETILYDILNKKIKNMLLDYLINLEQILKTDCIAYYGKIEQNFVSYFLKLAQQLSKNKNSFGKDRLFIILFSDGGIDNALNTIKQNLFRYYDNISFIIPDSIYSSATIFSFMGEIIYIDEHNTTFGMIDEQILTYNPLRPYQPLLDEISFIGNVKYYFNNDTSDIKQSMIFDTDNINHELKHRIFNEIESVKRLREFSYDLLINYNLKNDSNKENHAIRIINYLMDLKKHFSHSAKISPDFLIENGMNIKYYNNIPELDKLIYYYHSELKNIIGKNDNFGVFDNTCGNHLNCIIHSKINTIF